MRCYRCSPWLHVCILGCFVPSDGTFSFSTVKYYRSSISHATIKALIYRRVYRCNNPTPNRSNRKSFATLSPLFISPSSARRHRPQVFDEKSLRSFTSKPWELHRLAKLSHPPRALEDKMLFSFQAAPLCYYPDSAGAPWWTLPHRQPRDGDEFIQLLLDSPSPGNLLGG